MTKILKINSETQQIEELQISSIKEIAPAINNECNRMAMPHQFKNGDAVFMDAESILFKPFEGGIVMSNRSNPIIGNAVLVGIGSSGEMVDVRTTKEELEQAVTWLTKDEAQDWVCSQIDESSYYRG